VQDVMGAVETFERHVSSHLPAALTSVDGGSLTSKACAKLYYVWPTNKPSGIHHVAQRRVHALSQNEIDAADGVPTEWSIVPGSEGRGL
jgi:hypothetical protein